MKIFVTVLTLAAIFVSSEAGPEGRITYGHYANPDQFRYYVGISRWPGKYADVYCGGALISNNWVVTTAHCVDNMPAVTLHFGCIDFSTPALALRVSASNITKHPGYIASTLKNNTYVAITLVNDIALIKTDFIEYTHKIHKVSLPSMAGIPDIAREVVIGMGWGMDEFGVYDNYNLKYVFMRVITNAACKPHYLPGLVTEKNLCAMTHSGSICFGDSGGPLVHHPTMTLVGISSFVATRYCDRGIPAVFVRVTEYLDWIKNVSGVYRA